MKTNGRGSWYSLRVDRASSVGADAAARGSKHGLERGRQVGHLLAAQEEARLGGDDLEVDPIVLAEAVQEPDELVEAARDKLPGLVLGRFDDLHGGRVPDNELELGAGREAGGLDLDLMDEALFLETPQENFYLDPLARRDFVLIEPDPFQGRLAEAVRRTDDKIDPMDPEVLELIVGQEVDDGRNETGRVRRRIVQVSRVQVLEVDPHAVVKVDIALEIEGQVTVGALLPAQERGQRDIEEGGAKNLVVDDLELELADGTAFRLEPEVDGDEARHLSDLAHGARRPVLAESADQSFGFGELERALQAGDDGDDPGFGHGEIDGPQVIEGMTEGENFIPVHVGHGPDRRDVGVAADDLDANRIPLAKGEIGSQDHVLSLAGNPAQDGNESHPLEQRLGFFDGTGCHAPEDQRQAEPPGRPASRLQEAFVRKEIPVPVHEIIEAQPIRQGQADRRGGPRRRPFADGQHLLDGRDSGDGFFGVGKAVGDRADDLAVQEDGTAAHALDDSGLVDGFPPQPGQDQVPPGLDVGENAQDLDVGILRGVAGEDAPGLPGHARLDIAEGHRQSHGPSRPGAQAQSQDEEPEAAETKDRWVGFHSGLKGSGPASDRRPGSWPGSYPARHRCDWPHSSSGSRLGLWARPDR